MGGDGDGDGSEEGREHDELGLGARDGRMPGPSSLRPPPPLANPPIIAPNPQNNRKLPCPGCPPGQLTRLLPSFSHPSAGPCFPNLLSAHHPVRSSSLSAHRRPGLLVAFVFPSFPAILSRPVDKEAAGSPYRPRRSLITRSLAAPPSCAHPLPGSACPSSHPAKQSPDDVQRAVPLF